MVNCAYRKIERKTMRKTRGSIGVILGSRFGLHYATNIKEFKEVHHAGFYS